MSTPHNFAPDYSVAEAAAWTGEPAGNKRSSLPIIVGVVGAVVVLVAAIVVFALNWGSGLTSSPRAEQIAMTQSESGAQIARGTSAPASAATASSAGASTAAQEKETETVTVEKPAPAPAPVPAPAPAPVQGSPAPAAGGASWNDYTQYSARTSNTSAGFAQNVYQAFMQSYVSTGSRYVTVSAYSPATGGNYTMSCGGSVSRVICSGGDNASVSIY
ncbi:hypothetical protein [Corynebacterium flavescens]|uniref:hypothetical protein n=1 Tax=Corynebacterium flavescens TaxID=28028 RepID=UPI000EDE5533|nr:hypothetical protein [Corynebacterium flavescens]